MKGRTVGRMEGCDSIGAGDLSFLIFEGDSK